MNMRTTLFTLMATMLAVPSFAGPSGQHSAQSVDHSGQAASNGSAAVSTGTALVSAIPIVAFGSTIAISGAAIEDVGIATVATGNDLFRVGAGQAIITQGVTPDGPPTLD